MRFRFWMLVALALMLAALAGCANAPGGGRGGPTLTPGPIKTLRPTFTSTPAKPKPTVTPGGAAAQAPVPAGQAQPAQALTATVAPTAAPPTPEPSPTPVPPSPTPEKASMTVSSPGATNVRSGPGTAFAKLGEVQQGQSFEITGKNQVGTWWQFSFNGQPAWISGEMVSANAAAKSVQVAASVPTAPVQPTAAPRPVQPAPAPVQPTAVPPPPAAPTKFRAAEARGIINPNDWVTIRCQLTPDSVNGIAGTLRVMRDGNPVAPDQVFGVPLNWANSGMSIENRYIYNENCKIELRPVIAGNYTAVLVEGGTPVSEPLTFTVSGDTREYILVWKPR